MPIPPIHPDSLNELAHSHPNAKMTWDEVRKTIAASEKYASLTIELRPQYVLGLVPLGPNPRTGYFEFYHLRSAWDGESDLRDIAIPTHREDGSIEVKDETGIVFVLLPGGEVTLGSQDDDDTAPYYDADRHDDEDLHDVTLDPFFLARHQLTQGQWARLWSGDEDLRRPSYYAAGETIRGIKVTLAHPAETVDWHMSQDLLASHGLDLPTEAQWEYGCRGGSTTTWACDLDELKHNANVCYESESSVAHAPVGSLLPNAFGLHDMHGNVWEWCLDAYSSYGSERLGDGLRPLGASSDRVYRGGSFNSPAVFARSAARYYFAPTIRYDFIGLRPARTLRIRD